MMTIDITTDGTSIPTCVAIPAEDASLHTVSFEVAYTLDQADLWSTVDIILVAALAVGGFA